MGLSSHKKEVRIQVEHIAIWTKDLETLKGSSFFAQKKRALRPSRLRGEKTTVVRNISY
jgi:hypothetical protein